MTNTPEKQALDPEVLSRLLQVTREKLSAAVLGTTELETLLVIEREKTAALEAKLTAATAENTTDTSQ